jgi:chorismate dehydratase
VGAVSYLNTKPLLYGIKNSPIISEISLVTEYPSRIADMLMTDDIDIGLVPVSIVPDMKEYYFYTDFCIGCDGPVASVCLFSEVSLREIDTVLLDNQSRTSVALAKILFQKHWKINPVFEAAGPDFIKRIKGNTGAVVIGDRALDLRSSAAFVYDLGEAWKQMTGLPFVFAAWISNKKLDSDWVERFNQANATGIENMSLVWQNLPDIGFNLETYYTQNLSYAFDTEKKKGLDLFLKILAEKH